MQLHLLDEECCGDKMPRSKVRKNQKLGRKKASQMLTISTDDNSTKKKILWANSFCMLDTSSGASISIRQMLLQLANNGFDVEIVGATIFDDPKGIEGVGNAWQQLQKAQTSVVNIPDGKLLHRLVKTISTERRALTEQEATNIFMLFLTRLDYFVPDLIFFYGGSILNSLIASEARLRGIPTVAYLVNENYQGSRWCQDVDLIVTDTNATSNFYKEKMGFIPKVIGKFIDPKKIIATQHERKHLTFVNPSYAKGAGIIAQIAIILEKKRPDITLEIVESRGDWPSILKDVSRDFFKEEKLTLSNVILTPNTKSMDEVYKRSRVLLGLSVWWESGSRVLAEAMLNGIPAIVTNNGGSPEMVGNGGFVIDLPRDCFISPYNKLPGINKINEIIVLIEKLWDDELFYLNAMTNALQIGFQKHDISVSTKKIINEFNELMQIKPVSCWKEKLKEAHLHGLYPDELHYGVVENKKKNDK